MAGVADVLRRHYHSTYLPSTIIFNKNKELEEALAGLGVNYSYAGSLITVEMSELAEKLPELAEWLQREKREAEQRLAKLNTSKRNEGGSTGSSGNERGYSLGGASSTTVVRLYESHYNILLKIVGDERFKQLVQRVRSKSYRTTTSIKVDSELWRRFKDAVFRRGLEVSEVLEELILLYVVHTTESSTTRGVGRA